MMIGSPDDHRVDPVAFCFDHFAIVGVAAWFKVVFFNQHRLGFIEVTGIDIHDSDDVFADHTIHIFSRPICRADASDVQLF